MIIFREVKVLKRHRSMSDHEHVAFVSCAGFATETGEKQVSMVHDIS